MSRSILSKEYLRLPPFDLKKGYKLLLRRWGPQQWWPGDSQTEIIAGAVLAQATNWQNAARALANLKSKGLLEDSGESLERFLKLAFYELSEMIRPSVYFHEKARRLSRLMVFLEENLGTPPWKIPHSETPMWRKRLLEIKGLGPETVDSILLYGFDLPGFVVDAYTRRMLLRHQMISERTSYEDIKLMFESNIPKRSKLYNEYHALIVRLGKEHCRSVVSCSGCPLAP